jgi:GNAT superfamily N-acetyltransferase
MITKPRPNDLPVIEKILSQWTETKEKVKYVNRIEQAIGGKTEYGMRFWVAREGNLCVGVAGLSDPLPKVLSLAKTDKPGEIKILYVDKDSQGKGAGRALIEYLEKSARESGYKELLVRSAERYRETAYGFYEKVGYEKAGKVPGGEEGKEMQVFGKVLIGKQL